VLVGTVARVHGLRGDVIVAPETDFPDERFAPGATLLVRDHGPEQGSPRQGGPGQGGTARDTLTVESSRAHGARLLVRFVGVTTIEQAEALGRPQLWMRAVDRPAPPEGHFYHDALIGCRVETVAGDAVGAVTRVDDTGGVPLLVIASEAGAESADEVLVPLAEAICRVIDPAGRRIVIDPPDGLLDVNRR
jgi:16S rRNA processing protein RimM